MLIMKESHLHRQLSHPHIVQLYDMLDLEDAYVMIMEYMTHGELFDYVSEQTSLNEDQVRSIMKQLLSAILYLHVEKGIIHRDIKLENILMSWQPEGLIVKLADFGFAKCVNNQPTDTPLGTIGFNAPEITEQMNYGKAVDLWSMGCLMYTLLCGYSPFQGITNEQIMIQSRRAKFSFHSQWWNKISDSAKTMIRHLITESPLDRYTVQQALQDPWLQNSMTQHAAVNVLVNAPTMEYSKMGSLTLTHDHLERHWLPPIDDGPLDKALLTPNSLYTHEQYLSKIKPPAAVHMPQSMRFHSSNIRDSKVELHSIDQSFLLNRRKRTQK
jgi:serine/threonine protein kinase